MPRTLEITVNSASGLSNKRTYAVAWISNDPSNDNRRHRTPVDTENGGNPIWNHVINFTLHESALQQQSCLFLEIGVYTGRDQEIGHARVPLMDFLNSAGCQNRPLPLIGPSEQPSGNLFVSVKPDVDVDSLKVLKTSLEWVSIGVNIAAGVAGIVSGFK